MAVCPRTWFALFMVSVVHPAQIRHDHQISGLYRKVMDPSLGSCFVLNSAPKLRSLDGTHPRSRRSNPLFAGKGRTRPTPEQIVKMGADLQGSEKLLAEFDTEQQQYARDHKEGFGGGTSATKFAEAYQGKDDLRNAVVVLTAEAETVMLGFCAESAEEGVNALKEWVSALQLPRGRLHGMDEEGVPLDMSTFGSVYIKYSSKGGQVFEPGDANLNGYDGAYRGVYFNPVLPDGEFRQYAVLPLDLFHEGSRDVPHVLKRTSLTVEEVQELLSPVQASLTALGGFVSIVAVHPDTSVVELKYSGPDALSYGVRDALLASPHIKDVAFVS